ncbi:tRNA (adenosine(37)-N6)-threonylcarbamoyltransferase complex ATPase subunit type 1 TsaE [Tenuibacillus multivorans]|uniref:tRNA threonylcarbamoyladenosine biosynthesis protein TsaE n=1 Tax=Tenuibacillus multivorans TaxID=237069 RepID=A0A1H0E4N3_9BACI|nr:tRNA (adenosine(37)-N6)-threonylcarbamoyltransferase complex ATPase subunit type 1 TsaE [Tenuibacillus multivorans]GEL76652.1 tRNA (adenosine(37)-N6)-threonylcarbamoyltransferase complex ATPase subunit type 1 TsaE [Tenuibacillus multivorans]SDN77404.1 tRNA threonylcarbamoyladenosine biosynthesis protein TsaE [Tenuibacillus multivorans]
MYTFKTNNENETQDLAETLASFLKPGDVLTLDGDLGAGKTTFAKGLARGLGVKRTVNSPTYTIIKEYRGRLPLYHMDVYRLEDSDEDIGFDEYFNGIGVTVVEWSSFIEEFLPKERLEIEIKKIDDDERKLILTPKGERFQTICKELKQ